MSGRTIPDASDVGTCDNAEQASAAVSSMKTATLTANLLPRDCVRNSEMTGPACRRYLSAIEKWVDQEACLRLAVDWKKLARAAEQPTGYRPAIGPRERA
jgi:hypothetical protein